MLNRRSLLAAPLLPLPRPALGQDTRARTLLFVPQANLTSIDPI